MSMAGLQLDKEWAVFAYKISIYALYKRFKKAFISLLQPIIF